MQLGDAVRAGGQAEPHHGHVELLDPVLVRVGAVVGALAEREQLVERHPALGGELAEVVLHELATEAVDARRHRRVCGEHAAARAPLRPPRRRAGPRDLLADPLQAEEPGVALVHVEHLRVDAECPQRPNPADAEDDLLAQPVVRVPGVQAVGDLDPVGRVLGEVGVEQVQRDLADVGPPHPGPYRVAGEIDRHCEAGVGEPERLGVHVDGPLLLPAVGVELLVEVALGVQQANPDERHTEIGRRLEVVTGENAEAARVLRERLGDAELGREVRHRGERAVRASPPNQLGPVIAASSRPLAAAMSRTIAWSLASASKRSDVVVRTMCAGCASSAVQPGQIRSNRRTSSRSQAQCRLVARAGRSDRASGIAERTSNRRTGRIGAASYWGAAEPAPGCLASHPALTRIWCTRVRETAGRRGRPCRADLARSRPVARGLRRRRRERRCRGAPDGWPLIDP